MKRRLFMLSVTLAVFFAPLYMGASGTVTYTATYDGTPVLGTDTLGGVTYTTVRMPGLYNTGEPGTPSLPVDYIRFSVPYNAINLRVTSTCQTGSVVPLSHPVYPCQRYQNGQIIITPPSNSPYLTGGEYPDQLAWVENESMVAGENHVVTVAVMPFIYSRSTGDTLRVMQSVSVTLTYDQGTPTNVMPMVRRGAVYRDEGYEMTANLVVNPSDVRSNAVPASSRPMFMHRGYYVQNDTVTNPDTYIIITTPELKHAMRRLAALRMQKGKRVKLVTVAEAVNDSVAGNGDQFIWGGDTILTYTDDAGKLRQYLRHHYLHRGTDYALLAGTDVPYRRQSDMYYCDFNKNWMISTFNNPNYDCDSEIYASRLLGSTTKQFDNYTDKLLRYELNPGNGDYSYLNRNLYVQGIELEPLQGTLTSINPVPRNNDMIINGTNSDVSGNYILGLINDNHYGLMSTFCEATRSHIKVSDDGSSSHYIWAIDTIKASNITDSENGNGLNRMDNKEYPMLYFAPFGETMSHNTLPGDVEVNYGESFTMGKDYGGPTFIGLINELSESNNIYSMCAEIYSNVFFSGLEQHSEIGKVQAYTKSNLPSPYEENMATAYNMLGDPALDKWTGAPQLYSGIIVTRTDNAVTVSGISTPSTIIGYCSNDGVIDTCCTSSSSVTLSGVSPNSTIMLYKHNSIPYIAPLVLQNTTLDNPQYVFATDVTAGRAVDSQRTQGDVVVEDGVEYEIEASGTVTLAGGFKVEQGATFAVRPATYK